MPRRKGCVRGGSGGKGRRCSKRLKSVISAKEIEAGISSTSTVEWNPFSVLPKEIYVEIFNKLDSPTDKQNFMNAHTKWYELFKAERVKFLFGKVFGVLDVTLNEEEDLDEDENLIDLRLVCREWDESIQKYYQLHPDHFQFSASRDRWRGTDSKHLKKRYANGYFIKWERVPLDDEDYYDADGNDYDGGYVYMSRKRNLGTDMGQFLASHPPSKNPFLTRKISIEINSRAQSDVPVSEDEELQTLLSQLDTLMDTYGQHVWHFNYWGFWGLEPEMYSRILQWLRLMPELRTLQMHFGYRPGTDPCGETKMFKNILRIESPELRKLQYLHVKSFSSCVFNKLLEGMKAIEKVKVTFPPQLLGFKFPERLTEAALKLIGHEDIKYLNTLEQLPALRKLIIDLDDKCSGTWSTIWMAIEEKFPALEDLHLTLPTAWGDGKEEIRYKMMEQSLDCRLNLKKLKRLTLTLPGCIVCLDFIQEIKTLQELKIDVNYSQDKFKGFHDLVRRERVQFHRDWGTMWESNIWQELHNLRKLSIRNSQLAWIKLHLYEKGAKGKQMYKIIEGFYV